MAFIPRPPRPFAESTPAVTVYPRPNGEPMATTHSPTRAASESANLAGVETRGVDLDHGEVGRGIAPDEARRQVAPVAEAHVDGQGLFDDVVVREDRAVRREDDARAHAPGDGLVAARRGRRSERGDRPSRRAPSRRFGRRWGSRDRRRRRSPPRGALPRRSTLAPARASAPEPRPSARRERPTPARTPVT